MSAASAPRHQRLACPLNCQYKTSSTWFLRKHIGRSHTAEAIYGFAFENRLLPGEHNADTLYYVIGQIIIQGERADA